MKKKNKLFSLILVMSVVVQVVFMLPAFAKTTMNKDSGSVDGVKLILNIVDSEIVVENVEAIHLILGEGNAEVENYTDKIKEKNKGEKPKTIQADGIFYRIYDGKVQVTINSSSHIARVLGKSSMQLKVRILQGNNKIIEVTDTIKGNFATSSDTPYDGDDNTSKYLFKDYQYTSSSEHWAYDYVKHMSSKSVNIVRGTTDNRLLPDSPITLKEFIAMLARTLKYMDKADDTSRSKIYGFERIDNDIDEWVWGEYAILMNAFGEVSEERTNKGKTELDKVLTGTESLNSFVTRQEAAVMIAAFLGDSTNIENPNEFYDWNNVRHDFKGRVARLCELGIMFGSKDSSGNLNYVYPTKEISRVEVVTFLSKLIELEDYVLVEPESDTLEEVTASDLTAPVITFVPNGGSVKPKAEILINISDLESNITKIRYSWDGEISNTVEKINKKDYTLELNAPKDTGKHTLRVWARNAGGKSTGWKTVEYNVNKNAQDVDTTPPNIKVMIGSKQIGFYTSIEDGVENVTIEAEDKESGIKQIVYYWDNEPQTVFNGSRVDLNLPEDKSIYHYLYVKAQNGAGLISEEVFEYRCTGNNNDLTPPEVYINTNLTQISTIDIIKLTAKDSETGVNQIVYRWDSNSNVTIPVNNAVEVTIPVDVPDTVGNHTLYVKARNGEGDMSDERTYAFNVVNSNVPLIPGSIFDFANDNTPPYVAINTTNTNLFANDKVEITVEDNESAVTDIVYYWDYNSEAVINTNVFKTTFRISVPNLSGQHTLHVKAKNGRGTWSTEVTRVFNINGNGNGIDNTPPVLSIDLNSSQIAPGATIRIKAEDRESGVNQVAYRWNSALDIVQNYNSQYEVSISVQAPITAQTHTLYAKARNSSGNWSQEMAYTFVVGNPNDPNNPNNSAPLVYINTNNSNLSMNDMIEVIAEDNINNITKLVYYWDGENESLIQTGIPRISIMVSTPKEIGQHTLYVKACNGNGIWSQEISRTFTIGNSNSEKDTKKPKIKINTAKNEISIKDVIKLTVTDEDSGVRNIAYRWNNEREILINSYDASEIVVPIRVPQLEGDYELYIRAQDAGGNVEEKRYNFYVKNSNKPTIDDDNIIDYENDKTPPVVSIDTSKEKISTVDKIQITAYDNESGISQLIYHWDSEPEVVIPCNALKFSVKIPAYQKSGTHHLYVKAVNGATSRLSSQEILKSFEIIQSNSSLIEDEVDSTIKVIIDGDDDDSIFNDGSRGNVVEIGTSIIITGEEPDEIEKIGYRWNNEDEVIVKKNEVKIEVPDEEGVHYLFVRFMDVDGEWSDTRKYKFIVKKDIDDVEIDEVKVEIKKYKNNSLVSQKFFDWEDIENKRIVVKSPKSEGSYWLYVIVLDEDENIVEVMKQKFNVDEDDENNIVTQTNLPKTGLSVAVSKNGKDSEDAGLITYPGNPEMIGTVNPNITSLRVEIRNADEKSIFESNEEIKYYIDFYNGDSKDLDNVKIVFNPPEGFIGVSASDNGVINNEGITWEIGKIKKGASGRYTVVIKYNMNLSEDYYFTPKVEILVDQKMQDLSIVYNMLYKIGGSGAGYHYSYVVGYPDGTFKPQGTITRAEMAAMCANLFGLYAYTDSTFYDMSSSHWANSAVNACVGEGLIDAYGEYFDPDSPATRSIFAIALARFLEVDDIEPIYINSIDTEGHYAMKEIEQLIRLGLIEGYPDGSAGPNNLVTRAEAVTMLNKYAFRGGLTISNNSSYGNSYVFSDLSNGHWALSHILEAALDHTYNRTASGDEILY